MIHSQKHLKMKNFSVPRPFFFFWFITLLLLFINTAAGQSEWPYTETEDGTYTDTTALPSLDSILFQSPNRLEVEAACAIRYAHNADIYLRWKPIQGATGYQVVYRLGDALSAGSTAQANANELLLEGLPLDTIVFCEVIPLGADLEDEWQSDVVSVSTAPQSEPIVVWPEFYNRLAFWFSKEENEQELCQFLEEVEGVSPYEKLAFLQAYAFDNAAFVKPPSGNASEMPSWLPPDAVFGSGEERWCVPLTNKPCRCKVISMGSNLATPNLNMAGYKVTPKIVLNQISKGESERRSEAGAAKFVLIRQDRGSGANTIVRSNLPVSDDSASVTPAASRIAFFLACLQGGIPNTNLPPTCNCVRPLHVYYEYTTNLRIKAQVKGCPFSRGSEASAEDWAFVAVLRQKTGDLEPLAAGRVTFNSSCSSNWNPDFWIRFLDFMSPLIQYLVQVAGGNDSGSIPLPTPNSIGQFITALQGLIETPFAIRNSDGCMDAERAATLVSGSRTYQLRPNEPITVFLFSSYYLRTRGYGCWRAEAGVASDYYLLGVVESEAEPTNEECCAKKFANYIVGSQSDPIIFPLRPPSNPLPVNSIADRLQNVGFLLSLFGGWDNLPTVPGSGVVVLTREFDKELRGPSCILEGRTRMPQTDEEMSASALEFRVFPNPTNDLLNVQVGTASRVNLRIGFHDALGRLVRVPYSGEIEPGRHLLPLPVMDLPKGAYIVRVYVGAKRENFRIFIF